MWLFFPVYILHMSKNAIFSNKNKLTHCNYCSDPNLDLNNKINHLETIGHNNHVMRFDWSIDFRCAEISAHLSYFKIEMNIC